MGGRHVHDPFDRGFHSCEIILPLLLVWGLFSLGSFLFGIPTKELGKFCQADGRAGKQVWEPSRGQARRLKAFALVLTAAGVAMRCSHLGKTCQLSFS